MLLNARCLIFMTYKPKVQCMTPTMSYMLWLETLLWSINYFYSTKSANKVNPYRNKASMHFWKGKSEPCSAKGMILQITYLKLTLSWSCTPLYLFLKKNENQLYKMTASWTFGHYPPGEFPFAGFSSSSQRKVAEQSCDKVTDKRWAERGSWVKGGNVRDRKRQTLSRLQTRGTVLLRSRLGWDKLSNFWSSATSFFLLPLKEKKEKEEGGKRRGWAGRRKKLMKTRHIALFGLDVSTG